MRIPEEQLESIIDCLRHLVDERTSAPQATYSDDEHAMDDQDIEDAESVKTVLDVLKWLRDHGGRTELNEYSSCLDPLGKFDEVSIPNDVDLEAFFRDYLVATYDIDPKEFKYMQN